MTSGIVKWFFMACGHFYLEIKFFHIPVTAVLAEPIHPAMNTPDDLNLKGSPGERRPKWHDCNLI